MRRYVMCVVFFGIPLSGWGQYFHYSQYNFTDQRINPALVAATNYASAGLIFRNQGTGASDVQLKSSMVSGVYPILSRKTGERWSGIGISFLDDRSAGIFSMQEASLSYAINIFLSRFQSISLGFKGLYQQRSVDFSGLYTGSQYIPDRGFDQSMSNGENVGLLHSDFATFSSGLYWQHHDRQGRKVAYWGISFFDINRPEDSFLGTHHRLQSTWVASGGLQMYHRRDVSITPEFLFTHSSTGNILNVGAITSYELKPYPNRVAGRVDVITKYVPRRSGILGLQFHKEQFSVGFSYDFPVLKKNPANVGAFEIGLQIKRLVDPLYRKRSGRKNRPSVQTRNTRRGPEKEAPQKTMPGTADAKQAEAVRVDTVAKSSDQGKRSLKSSLREKADSVIASARAGHLSHEPFVIEKLNLHFNFEFNSAALDKPSAKYLDDLSEALKENEEMKVRLTGHTDNVGSPGFNMRLSVYRAHVIRQYLIDRGVDARRIETAGKGLTEPLNENKTEAERALNRRVELVIYYQQ